MVLTRLSSGLKLGKLSGNGVSSQWALKTASKDQCFHQDFCIKGKREDIGMKSSYSFIFSEYCNPKTLLGQME